MRILEFSDQLEEDTQLRVTTGDKAQRQVYSYIRANVPGLKLGRPQYAKKGSQGLDLVMNINDQRFVFEVKNRTTRHVLIQLFSEQVRRGDPGLRSAKFLKMLGQQPNLTAVIDYYRKGGNTQVGFAGDPGVDSASGRMPALPAPPPAVCRLLRDEYVNALQQNGINYFVIYTMQDDSLQIYHTGLGNNVLKAPLVPVFPFARLDTAGSADYPKTIRAAVKARFA